MNVLIRGVGNIGTTLANLLLAHRQLLGIDQLAVLKRAVPPYLAPDLELLKNAGARVHVGADGEQTALGECDFLFDCRTAGAPLRDLARYTQLPALRGACAQGTEHGFGVPFVTGVNDQAIRNTRFVQVASCNTHAVSTLLHALSRGQLDQVQESDFVVVRRAEDIGNHERLVSGTVVARHRDAVAGTHHSQDALRVFDTIGQSPTITSSDVTAPSQLLHTVRFSLRLNRAASHEDTRAAIEAHPFLSSTKKFDASRIFELGRRYGFQGRIFSHAIVVANNLLVSGSRVSGWAFIPQEGNTLLSSVAALLESTGHADAESTLATLAGLLLRRSW